MTLLQRIVAARRLSLARERAKRAGIRPTENRPTGISPEAPVSAERGGSTTLAGESGIVGAGCETGAARDRRAVRPFSAALRAPGRRVIAEIKRRSPSAGVIRDPLDPAGIAAMYARAGAAALSVLTEPDFFAGSDGDLQAARDAVGLPVLRKDFLLDRDQIFESRALGADAVLLIGAVLSRDEISGLLGSAREAGLDALVEVHSEEELDAALEAGASIIGVNSRNLEDFSVDVGRAVRLGARIPAGVLRVAESGIRTREDVSRLEQAGYRAFLVGESLLRAPDPAARLRELFA